MKSNKDFERSSFLTRCCLAFFKPMSKEEYQTSVARSDQIIAGAQKTIAEADRTMARADQTRLEGQESRLKLEAELRKAGLGPSEPTEPTVSFRS